MFHLCRIHPVSYRVDAEHTMSMSEEGRLLHDEDMMNFTPLLHQHQHQQLPPPPQVDHVQPRLIATRPTLSDAATREERKVVPARTRDSSCGEGKMDKGRLTSSTEDEEDETKRARVVFPPPETVQG